MGRFSRNTTILNERFERSARLLCKADYDWVFKDAVGAGSRHFRILGRRTGDERSRVGLIVSKKVDKRAVGRNRVKRIVREYFRQRRAELLGWDFVVLAKGGASHEPGDSLRHQLARCFRRFDRPRAERAAP